MQKTTNTENAEKEYKEVQIDPATTTVVAVKPTASWADIAAGRSKPTVTTTVTHRPPVYQVGHTITFINNDEYMNGKVVDVTRASNGAVVYTLEISKHPNSTPSIIRSRSRLRTSGAFKRVKYLESLLVNLAGDPYRSGGWYPVAKTDKKISSKRRSPNMRKKYDKWDPDDHHY